MARFEDYVKEDEGQPEGIEAEIQEAGEAQAERATLDVPESVLKRFEGKSQEDVLNSYAQLEQKFSEQGNKMGELRKSFDDYVVLQSQAPSEPTPEPAPAPEPVTVDDLYENPENAVARVVEAQTGDKLKALEEELQAVRQERAINQFDKAHPDARATVQTDEFAEWVQASPYRLRLAKQANAFDIEAANELFGLYDDSQGRRDDINEAAQREAALRDATLESSSPGTPTMEETFSRSDIINHKLRAKQGDSESQVWLSKNGAKINQAYQEGRVID